MKTKKKANDYEPPTLEQIWEKSKHDVIIFIERASIVGYGRVSLKRFFEEKGIEISDEQIDRIRCPLLYGGKSK